MYRVKYTFSAVQQKLVLVRYLGGMEFAGMILHNIAIIVLEQLHGSFSDIGANEEFQ